MDKVVKKLVKDNIKKGNLEEAEKILTKYCEGCGDDFRSRWVEIVSETFGKNSMNDLMEDLDKNGVFGE